MYNLNHPSGLPGTNQSPIQNTSFNTSKQSQRNSSGNGPSHGAKTQISKTKTVQQDYDLKSHNSTQSLFRPNMTSIHASQRPLLKSSLMQNQGGMNQKLPRISYQDQFDERDQMAFGQSYYNQKSSSIASRQVYAYQNRISKPPSVHPLSYINNLQQKSMEQKKIEADLATQQLEDELLNKYRNFKKDENKINDIQTQAQFSSVNTGISTLQSQKQRLVDTEQDKNKSLKRSLIEEAAKEDYTIDLRNNSPKNNEQLNLEDSFDDSQFEIEDIDPNDPNLFKQIKDFPVSDPVAGNNKGRIEFQSIKEHSSSIVEIDEPDIEITSEHMKSDSSASPKKKTPSNLFQQRKQLNYGGQPEQIKKIQNSFYSKYFDKSNTQQQSSDTQLKQYAKSNQFLMGNNSNLSILSRKLPIPSQLVDNIPNHSNQPSVNDNEINKALYLDKSIDLKECKKMIKRKNWKILKETEQKKKAELEKLKKQKLLLRKKKQALKKKEQDKVLNELFDYDLDENNNENDDEQKKNSLRGKLEEESSESEKPSDDDIEIDLDEKQQEAGDVQLNNNSDDQAELMRQRVLIEKQREFEEKMRLVRFKNRWNVDELIQPLLNLEIIDMYMDQENHDPNMFPILPQIFNSSGQYFDMWHKLFLYETYNQLINQRNESDKDKEIAQMFGLKLKNDQSNKNFKGLLQKFKNDSKFISLKLSENDNNNLKNSNEQTGNYNTPYPNLDSLKEFDLLLLSNEQLETKNVKQLTSAKFLKEIQQKKGTMMAIVDGKRKQDKNFIYIRVDISHEQYINLNCSEYDFHQMFVYFFDSMSTRIREFRTVKSVEFYPNAQYILNPSIIPKRNIPLQDLGSDQSNSSDKIKPNPSIQKRMHQFVDTHSSLFNDSQKQAMLNVSNMNNVDFLLIQGPPGTGKTHTIKGIISMLNFSMKNTGKILVCAPSNAAIDEIVTRLISKGGLFGQSESESIQKVVRIGAIDYEPSQTVQKVMVATKLAKSSSSMLETPKEKEALEDQKKRWINDIQKVDEIIPLISKSRLKTHHSDIAIKEIASQILADKNQIDTFMNYEKDKKIKKLKAYQQSVRMNLRMQEEQRRQNGGNMSRNQRIAFEKKVIDSAHIICTTLAMSTNEKLDHLQAGDIDYLIVDEACQSVELNNLIPFEHEPRKVILVGDQQQLPATTFSENAEKTKYSRSMFERFLECGVERIMLEVQYRMHPLIREFPSNQFYEQRLRDADSIQKRIETSEFLKSVLFLIQKELDVAKFFDLTYSIEESSETSKVNNDEIEFIEYLLKSIILKVAKTVETKPHSIVSNFHKKEQTLEEQKKNRNQAMNKLKGLIGIISPYKSQVRNLKDKIFRLLRQYCDINVPQDFIEINTVDAFQGREKDIIIFSCVRSSKERQLGFVSDYRRMNVAITRARHCLFVVGNSNTLTKDTNWKAFINYCKNNKPENCYMEINNKNSNIFKFASDGRDNQQQISQFKDVSSNSNNQKQNQQPQLSLQTKENTIKTQKQVSNLRDKLGLKGLMDESDEEKAVNNISHDQSPKSNTNKNDLKSKDEKMRACSVDPNQNSESKIQKKFNQKYDTSDMSDMKSMKGDGKQQKSHDKVKTESNKDYSGDQTNPYKEDVKDKSMSNQSSSYQSYKPNVVYTKSDSKRQQEYGNSSSSNKQQSTNQQPNRSYHRNDRNPSEFYNRNSCSRFNDYNRENRNYHQNNQNKRQFDRDYSNNYRNNYSKNQDNYRNDRLNMRGHQFQQSFRDKRQFNNHHRDYNNCQENRSRSPDRPNHKFYKKRDQKEINKNNENYQDRNYNQNYKNKRPRY